MEVTGSPVFNRSASSNSTDLSYCSQVNSSARIVFVVVYSLVFLVGLVLNGFTLKVYFCSTKSQAASSVTIYLKNLAVADFLLSLCLPLRISHYTSCSVHVFRVYCNFGAAAFYLNMYASILFMGYIAANRYLKIVHPLRTNFFRASVLQKVRAAHVISTVTWTLLLIITVSYITVTLLTEEPSPPVLSSCDALHSKQLSVFYKIIHICLATIFILVLASLVFFYYSTSLRLSDVQQRQPASASSEKLAKSRRNMLVLVSVFCICFVPYHLVRLPYAFLRERPPWGQIFLYLKELAVMVSVLNVCLDPFIYFIFSKDFRAKMDLRRRSSTEQDPTIGANAVRRNSSWRISSVMLNRKTLHTTTRTIGVL